MSGVRVGGVVAILRLGGRLLSVTSGNIGHIMTMSSNSTVFSCVMPQLPRMPEVADSRCSLFFNRKQPSDFFPGAGWLPSLPLRGGIARAEAGERRSLATVTRNRRVFSGDPIGPDAFSD